MLGVSNAFVSHTAGVHLLAREGSNAAAAAKLKALLQALEKQEPRNPALWLRFAQPYARLAGDSSALRAIAQHASKTACKVIRQCTPHSTSNSRNLLFACWLFNAT